METGPVYSTETYDQYGYVPRHHSFTVIRPFLAHTLDSAVKTKIIFARYFHTGGICLYTKYEVDDNASDKRECWVSNRNRKAYNDAKRILNHFSKHPECVISVVLAYDISRYTRFVNYIDTKHIYDKA